MIPPEQDGDFVAAMEDVLDVYEKPYDPKRPVVCMDEQPNQRIGEERIPIPMKPADGRRQQNRRLRRLFLSAAVCRLPSAVFPLLPSAVCRLPPAVAKAYADRLEIHFTPKHGSGLPCLFRGERVS